MGTTGVPSATKPPMVTVNVLLFASYAEWTGRESHPLILTGNATVADLVDRVRATLPGGSRIPPRPLVAVNAAHAAFDLHLHDGDEVALLPPLAGG